MYNTNCNKSYIPVISIFNISQIQTKSFWRVCKYWPEIVGRNQILCKREGGQLHTKRIINFYASLDASNLLPFLLKEAPSFSFPLSPFGCSPEIYIYSNPNNSNENYTFWAELAIVGSNKTALKFRYVI